MASNYYKILNVSPDAKPDEIQRAYRALARRYHPDLNSAPAASKLMALINEAYEVLSEPHRRTEYDQKQQKKEDKLEGPVMQGAKDIVLKTSWKVKELSSWEFILKLGTRQALVAITPLLTVPVFNKILSGATGFTVVLAVRIQAGLKVSSPSAVVIDLLRSRIYAGDFPDPAYRDPFSAFIM